LLATVHRHCGSRFATPINRAIGDFQDAAATVSGHADKGMSEDVFRYERIEEPEQALP
jgi:hypothetical protein